MNLFRVPATAVHYTLTKVGQGTLNLQGVNTYTGGTQVNAGDVTLSGAGSSAALTADSEVQQLKLFGTNKPGTTSSIPATGGGTFTLSLTLPSGGNPITTAGIALSNNPTAIATAMTTAINNAINAFNLSNGTFATTVANNQPVLVTTTSANTANPYVFNIAFSGGANAQLNVPKIQPNITNAAVGVAGADIETVVQGTGREVQTINLGGTNGGLVSFQFNNQTRPYWSEAQIISIPFQSIAAQNAGNALQQPGNGDPVFVNLLSTPLQSPNLFSATNTNVGVAFSSTQSEFVTNLQAALDYTFGKGVFQATTPPTGVASPAGTITVAVQPWAAAQAPVDAVNDPGHVPVNGPNIGGTITPNTNLPVGSANVVLNQIETINFPTTFTNASTYRLNFLGYTSPTFTYDAGPVGTVLNGVTLRGTDTQYDNIGHFLDSIPGVIGNYFLNYNPGSNTNRSLTIGFNGTLGGYAIQGSTPGNGLIAGLTGTTVAGPAGAITVANTNLPANAITSEAQLVIPPTAVASYDLGISVGGVLQTVPKTGANAVPSLLTALNGQTPASADTVFAYLNAIPFLTGNIQVLGVGQGPAGLNATGSGFTVLFTNQLVGFNANPLQFVTVAANGTPTAINPPAGASIGTLANGAGNAVQQIQFTGAAGTSNSVTFNYNGTDSSAVNFTTTTTEDQIRAALFTISDLTDNVDVNGGVGGPWEVVFLNGLAGQAVQPITITNSNTTPPLVTVNPNFQVGAPPLVSKALNRAGVGNEVQVLSPKTTGANFSYSFAGRPGGALPPGTGLTANQVFTSLNSIPALVGNFDVLGSNGGPFTVIFFNNLATTNVPQLVSSQDNAALPPQTVKTFSEGQGNEVQELIMPTSGVVRLTYSGDVSGDVAFNANAGVVQTALNAIPALTGNVQVLGATTQTGPFLVRFTGALGRVNAGDLGFYTGKTIADNTIDTTLGTVLTPSQPGGSAAFRGAGDGFPGPGFRFTAGQSPTMADLEFYFNGFQPTVAQTPNNIPSVAALSTVGGLYLEGSNTGTGPFSLIYPAGRITEPVKIYTQTPGTAVTATTAVGAIQQLPESVSVAPGSTMTLDYTGSTTSGDRLPNSGLLVLNNSSLVINENSLSPTTETLGALVLTTNTSNSIRVNYGGQPVSAITFTGTGTTAPFTSSLTRMEGATLNLYTNNTFFASNQGGNELIFTGFSSFLNNSVNNSFQGLVGGTNVLAAGLGIVPWATLTSFVGDTSNQTTDLVTDIDNGRGQPFGGTSISLGKLASYDQLGTAGGNVRLNSLQSPSTGSFTLSTNLNALMIDNTAAGGGINLAVDSGVANNLIRTITSGTIISVGAGGTIGFLNGTNLAGKLALTNPTGTNPNAEPNFFVMGADSTQKVTIPGGFNGQFALGLPYYGSKVIGPTDNAGILRTIPLSSSPATPLTVAVLKAALEALPNIGVGNVDVVQNGVAVNGAVNFTVRFIAQLGGGPMPKMTVSHYVTTSGQVTVAFQDATTANDGLTINSNLSSVASGRKDRRGKLTLTGDNGGLANGLPSGANLANVGGVSGGRFTIMNGVVNVRDPNLTTDNTPVAGGHSDMQLGGGGFDRTVNAGAALEIQDSHNLNINLVLNGTGYGNDNSGAVRVFSTTDPQAALPANTAITGNVTLGAPNLLTNVVPNTVLSVGPNAYSIQGTAIGGTQGNTGDRLNLNGQTTFSGGLTPPSTAVFPATPPFQVSFNAGLSTVKYGDGTLALSGSPSNVGTTASTLYVSRHAGTQQRFESDGFGSGRSGQFGDRRQRRRHGGRPGRL